MKKCYYCKEVLPLENFGIDNSRKDGRISHCKKCHRVLDKLNRERIKKEDPGYFVRRTRAYANKTPRWRWCSNTIAGHRRSGYVVNIKPSELRNLALKIDFCPLCNTELLWDNKGFIKPNSPSLDRKENTKTLNLQNVWIICHKCNATKQDRSLNQFVDYCVKISNKFGDYTTEDSCILSQDFTVL